MSQQNEVHMRSQGFALITVLLFTIILSLLALAMIQVSLLEVSASGYYQSKILALIDAENKLRRAEHKLVAGEIPREAVLIPQQVCGVKFYRLAVICKAGATKHSLQSTYAKLDDPSRCEPKPKVTEGRQGEKQLIMNN